MTAALGEAHKAARLHTPKTRPRQLQRPSWTRALLPLGAARPRAFTHAAWESVARAHGRHQPTRPRDTTSAAASGEDLSIDIGPSRQVIAPHNAVAHQQHLDLSTRRAPTLLVAPPQRRPQHPDLSARAATPSPVRKCPSTGQQ